MYARIKRGVNNIHPERLGVIHFRINICYVCKLKAVRVTLQGCRLIAIVGDVNTEITVRTRLRGTGTGEETNGHDNKQYVGFEFQISNL